MSKNDFWYGVFLWAGLIVGIVCIGLGDVKKDSSFGLNELITIYGVLVVNYSNSMFGKKTLDKPE